MKTVTVHEAKTHLSQLIAHAGLLRAASGGRTGRLGGVSAVRLLLDADALVSNESAFDAFGMTRVW